MTNEADIAAEAAAALDVLVAAAREAGDLALRFFRAGERTAARVEAKTGGSPVTEADLAADALLSRRLRAAFPEAGWLSEETADDPERLARRRLIIVDPIDGTRAFVIGDPRWSVSIALVVDGRPVAGVVHAPALAETYAAARGAGATRNGARISASRRDDLAGARAAGPKPIVTAIAARMGRAVEVVARVPSLAYRLSMAASGTVDFGVAAADSHDWDIAAGDLLLEEAGAGLFDETCQRLVYNRPELRRGPLLAAPQALAAPLLAAFRAAIAD